MTFYNVISGILFLGACQALLDMLGLPSALAAATLAIVVCNEAIMTSDLVERSTAPVVYALRLKILDLVTFLLLAAALVVLVPDKAFDTSAGHAVPGAGDPAVFLLLLSAYWGVTDRWNKLSGQSKGEVWGPRLTRVPLWLSVVFGVAGIAAFVTGVNEFSVPPLDGSTPATRGDGRTKWIGVLGACVLLYLAGKVAFVQGRWRWLVGTPVVPPRTTRFESLTHTDLFSPCPECEQLSTVTAGEGASKTCQKCRGEKWVLTPAGLTLEKFVQDFDPPAEAKALDDFVWTFTERPSVALAAFLRDFHRPVPGN